MNERELIQQLRDTIANDCAPFLGRYSAVAQSRKLANANLAAPVAPSSRKPVAWIRYCSDGTYEGPIIHGRMEDMRKESGAWTPLYEAPVAPALVPLTKERLH